MPFHSNFDEMSNLIVVAQNCVVVDNVLADNKGKLLLGFISKETKLRMIKLGNGFENQIFDSDFHLQ